MRITIQVLLFLICGLTGVMLFMPGCAPRNPHEEAGFLGIPRIRSACIAGKVTDSLTGKVISGATLQVEPAMTATRITSDQDGFYYTEFTGGSYTLKFVKQGYRPAERTIQMKLGETVGWDVSLEPTSAVIVNAGKPVTGAIPGATITVKATEIIRDGSKLKGIHWEASQEEGGVSANLTGVTNSEVKVTLPGIKAYKSSLLYHLGKDGRLLNRWMVLGIVPADLRESGGVTLTVNATTTSGRYIDSIDITADLHDLAVVNPGLQNVVIGKPVLLHGKDQPSYAWSLAAPPGSSAVLKDTVTRNPYFTPDVTGSYIIREGGTDRLRIYAGSWKGAVVAKESEPRERWVGLKGCYCHSSDKISSKFIAWRDSGHADIFTECVNTVFRYEERCSSCHTVGFGGKTPDGGITSIPSYTTFRSDPNLWDLEKSPPIFRPRPTNYGFIFDKYPEIAKLANVQCENCHGPNDSAAHKTLSKTGAPERISIYPEVCAVCHDQSRDDLSYRQWHESKHSNYSMAIETGSIEKRGSSAGDCGRCHTGQGFLEWISKGKRATTLEVNGSAEMALTAEKVLPVTCAVCHESHASGNSFRSKTEKVPLRTIDPNRMHPREFRGESVGRGAICITCHSTVNGPHNDKAMPRLDADSAPHTTQADVLFGQNAFFIDNGAFKSHAGIEDACIWCHIKPVPKPSKEGYPRGGVNHALKSASGLCSGCHKAFNRDELMDATKGDLESLKKEVEDAIRRGIGARDDIRLAPAANGEADVVIRAADIRTISFLEIKREMGIRITTKTDDVYESPLGKVRQGDISLLDTEQGRIILKATWNYILIKNDGSLGVHNPRFVAEVLATTTERVRALRW
jgi:hypothetical protein